MQNVLAKTTRKLIVNGDDFGLSTGINRAIIEAHQRGILTSASLMATGAAFEEAVTAARDCPALSIGLHLALIEGKAVMPPSEIPTLASADGRLSSSLGDFLRKWFLGQVRWQEVEREFEAQLEKTADAGLRIDKLDSHLHIHMLPGIFPIVLALAKRHGIRWIRLPKSLPWREGHLGALMTGWKAVLLSSLAYMQEGVAARTGVRHPDHFAGLSSTGQLTEKDLVHMLQRLKPGLTEMMVHPGYPERLSDAWPLSSRFERHGELAALTSPRIQSLIDSSGIKLTNFRRADEM